MPWVITIREAKSRKVVLVSSDMKIAADDDRYDFEVHIVPVTEEKGMFVFGLHDFTRRCYCNPEIRPRARGREMVMHRETIN